jgi:3-octaprenyl-4-hydroxybenzoate carboxy-lyase
MNKAVIVVDDDVNPADPGEVMFAVTTRCNPSVHMDVIRGIPSTFLDPQVPADRRLNVATYWHALRHAGIKDKVYGYTRLMSEF